MRIIKNDNISFLAVPFGLRQKFHAAFTAMLCFDLSDPTLLLTEKELWKTAKGQLPEGTVLDSGMPKATGEFLVAGQCHSATGIPVTGQMVKAQVGSVKKQLAVYGNRYWSPRQGGGYIPTEPVPFMQMPMGSEQSFGGAGFAPNLAGKGIADIAKDGGMVRPLPNLELPGHTPQSPDETPLPATLLPLSVQHPQRAKLAGTYDNAWLKTRWPWYPDDLDSRFFNCATEDQWINGYFTGAEKIELEGMNPASPVQRSSLPRFRMRMFATIRLPARKGEEPEERFAEVENRIDTVWLFPSARNGMGIMFFRGLIESCDDEMSDVVSVYLAQEPLESQPKDIEYYREEQRRWLDRTVEIDKAPLAEAQERIAAFLNRIPDMQRDFDNGMAAGFHKAPVATKTMDELFGSSAKLLASFGPQIAQGEALAESFREKYGHLVKIDTAFLDRMKQTLGDMTQNLADAREKGDAALARADKGKKELADRLKAMNEEHRAKGLPEIPDINAKPPEKLWQESGFAFVQQCVKNLADDPAALDRLHLAGLRDSAIKQAFLGVNREPCRFSRAEWGLPPAKDNSPWLEIPAGFVIPRFDNATLTGIAIRTVDMLQPDPPALVEGSDGKPLAMPGFREEKLFARVADDLDCVLLQQQTWDFCSVVSLEKPGQETDKETASLLKSAKLFFVILPESGAAEAKEWEAAHPNAMTIILPKISRLTDARKEGVSLRELLIRHIPPGLFDQMPDEQKEVKPADVKPGMKLPTVDAAAMVKKYRGHADDFAAPIKEKAMAKKAEADQMIRDAIKKAGMDPDKVLAKAEAKRAEGPPFDRFDPDVLKRVMDEQKVKLKAAGMLTAEVEAKLDKGAADYARIVTSSAKLKAEGMARLEEGKKLLDPAAPKPEWAQKLYAQFGMDPKTGAQFTREQLVEMHSQGKSLAGMKLDGLDLSGLDLAGANLEKALCSKASFAGTNLKGANLKGCVMQEADLEKACLDGADLSGTMLQKANMAGVTARGATIVRGLFQDTDLTGADFSRASFDNALFQRAALKGALFTEATGSTAVFQESDLTGADFSKGNRHKWIFMNSALDNVNFRGAIAPKATFLGCTGNGLAFNGAVMNESRFIQKTSFTEADFRDCTLDSACIIDSELPGADFRGARMPESYLSGAKLQKANLYRVSARKGRWEKSDLAGAEMRGLDFMGGSLRKTRITSADLQWANLYGVEFTRAKVGDTRLDHANLKKSLLEGRVEYLDDDP